MQAANYGFFLVNGRRHEGAKTVPIEPFEAVGTCFCQHPSRSLGAAATTTRLQGGPSHDFVLGGCPRQRT